VNFYEKLEKYSSNIAIITGQSEYISYEELLTSADSIGKQINKRCLVFLVCKNCFESVTGYIGFLRAGAVLALISEKIDNIFFAGLLESYKPAYIYLPSEKTGFKINSEIVSSFHSYKLLKTDYKTNYSINKDLALLLSTSGSTGSPKFVRQSYKNINSNALTIAQYLKITSTDRPISTMPMNYTYMLSIINSHLLKGASIILTEATLMEKRFWKIIKENNATTFGGVPYIFEILKKLHFGEINLPSLKYITQAGGKLSQELTVEFMDICSQKRIKFYVMYGQTEATSRMSYLPWEYAHSKIGSMGIAIPGGEFWLEDGNGNIIKNINTIGELIYKGDNVTLGYSESYLDLCKGDENHGIMRTGDLAKRDQDGFYYITGRKNRFLKIFGKRVNLNEVEELIKSLGYDCACTGTDKNIKIFVSKLDDRDRISKYIVERTGINRAGFNIFYIEKIPRNEYGKVLYSAL